MFNNNTYLNRLYHHQRHDELTRRAERKFLIQQMRLGRPASLRFYRPALATLGRWLILSGAYLQRKSGERADLPPVMNKSASAHGA